MNNANVPCLSARAVKASKNTYQQLLFIISMQNTTATQESLTQITKAQLYSITFDHEHQNKQSFLIISKK